MNVTNIGVISEEYGTDQYVLVKRKDGEDLTAEAAVDYLLPLVYRRAHGPGSAYCDTVRCVRGPDRTDQVICIIEARRDV